MINGFKFVGKKMADSKMEDESKMSDDLRNTCKYGPLRDLKDKINSSNINSRDWV